MSKWGRASRSRKAPEGFDYIAPVLEALERELRERMSEPHEGKRQCEALWPVQQINWQRSRYVYDMYYKHARISRDVYEYCLKHKLVDANLIAKWKKPGYERLCSTYAINPKNFNYGTVSICRVPRQQLSDDQVIQEKHSGCRGCASGPGGYHNIFGNKYGQHLARIQIAREEAEAAAAESTKKVPAARRDVWADEDEARKYESGSEKDEGEEQEQGEEEKEEDNDDDDDDSDAPGPQPAKRSHSDATDNDDEDEDDDSDGETKSNGPPSKKKQRSN